MHCPECETTLQSIEDVTFTEQDATLGFIRASKRFYTTQCADCGRAIGTGVAGAQANSAGGAGVM